MPKRQDLSLIRGMATVDKGLSTHLYGELNIFRAALERRISSLHVGVSRVSQLICSQHAGMSLPRDCCEWHIKTPFYSYFEEIL